MKIQRSPCRPRRRQHGLTLVEMTVTILIALFLLAGLFTMVQSTRHAYTNQTQLSQLQDSERMAMSIMTDVIQSAGYYPNPAVNSAAVFTTGGSWVKVGQALYGTSPGANLDTISVRFATQPGDNIVNCLGNSNPLGSGIDPDVYTNTFWLSAPDAAGNRTLTCTLFDAGTNTSTDVPLVYGVQSMQIYYGVQRSAPTDANDNNVDTYLLGSEMQPNNPSGKNDWMYVSAVRVVLWFNNPLVPPSATAAARTIKFERVIAVMNRTGANS